MPGPVPYGGPTGWMAPFDEMFKMAPHVRARIPGSTSCDSSNGARTCTSNISRKCFSWNVSTAPNQVTAPLFTRMSTGPSWRSVSSTMRARSSGRARLAAIGDRRAAGVHDRLHGLVDGAREHALAGLGGARRHGDARPFGGEAAGDLGADAAAGSGDDGDASVQ